MTPLGLFGFRFSFDISIGWQGHCNPICAVAVSHNKKWVATADAGQDSMMVVWDTASGTPIKSIFNPHSNGVLAMDISADALFIVTLSDPGQSGSDGGDNEPQTISVWEWTHPSRKEALFTSVIDEPDIQKVYHKRYEYSIGQWELDLTVLYCSIRSVRIISTAHCPVHHTYEQHHTLATLDFRVVFRIFRKWFRQDTLNRILTV